MNKFFEQISLEADEQPLADGAGAQAIEDQEISGQVEAVNAEMQELEQAITTSEDAAEALEQVQEFVEAKQEANGGLTEGEAEAVQVATEALLSRFGGHIKVKQVSLESFGKEGGRATATSYTLENIGETIKKIWEAIKKWVKDFIAKAKDWFRAHFSAAGMLKKAGTALAEKGRTKVGTPEEKITLGGSERKWLSVSSGETDVSKNIKHLEELVSMVFDDKSLTEVKEAGKEMLENLKNIDLDKKSDVIAQDVANVFNPMMSKLDKFVGSSAATGKSGSAMKIVVVPGTKGKMLGAVTPQLRIQTAQIASGNAFKDVYVSYVLEYAEDKSTDKFGTEKDVKGLSGSEIGNVGEAISVIADAILNRAKMQSKNDEYTNKAIAQFDKMSAQLDKMDKTDRAKAEKGQGNNIKEIKTLIKNSSKILTAGQKMEQVMITYCMTVSRAWLSFGKRSLTNLSDKKA